LPANPSKRSDLLGARSKPHCGATSFTRLFNDASRVHTTVLADGQFAGNYPIMEHAKTIEVFAWCCPCEYGFPQSPAHQKGV
jgi:hypothetical protein